jgi:hypothetical protein
VLKDWLINISKHNIMGFIKEPQGVDFVIQSKPLTKKQEKELSEFISKRKLEIKMKSRKGTYKQQSV